MSIVISDRGNILADIFAKSEPDRRLLEMSEKEMINNTYDEGLSDSTGVILEFCDWSSAEHKAMLRQSVGTKLQILKAT